MMLRTIGIYIHFPYCISKCHYCDFFSLPLSYAEKFSDKRSHYPDDDIRYAKNIPEIYRKSRCDAPPPLEEKVVVKNKRISSEQITRYEKALLSELDARVYDFGRTEKVVVESIYFGGGTASLIPADSLYKILEAIKHTFMLASDCEITLEGNPDSLTETYLSSLVQLNINRVNAGIQSFNKNILNSIGRYYDEESYLEILTRLDRSNIASLGVDFMYGMPNQAEDDFWDDLKKALRIRIDHLSLYSLTSEPDTLYDINIKHKFVPPPNEEMQLKIFQALPNFLKEYDFYSYEISNFAKKGKECKHNLNYWLYKNYMGLGPSAHGFNGSVRYGNPRNIEEWIKHPAGTPPSMHEPEKELPLVMLRLTRPISLLLMFDVFKRSGKDADSYLTAIRKQMHIWHEKGFGTFTDEDHFQWSQDGILFLDDRIIEMIDLLEEMNP